jgi:16S rRNA (cytosine967-C5)-methyltransferase
LKPAAIADRQKQQREVLAQGARLVKPGGRMIYVTCSVLPQENAVQIAAFLQDNAGFSQVPLAAAWTAALPGEPPTSADGSADHLVLSPGRHGTDGFFISVLSRTT